MQRPTTKALHQKLLNEYLRSPDIVSTGLKAELSVRLIELQEDIDIELKELTTLELNDLGHSILASAIEHRLTNLRFHLKRTRTYLDTLKGLDLTPLHYKQIDPDTVRTNVLITDLHPFDQLTPAGPDRSRAICPFHEEATPSFTIYHDPNDRGDSFHCFGCQENGDIITFVMKTQHLNFPGALRFLQNK